MFVQNSSFQSQSLSEQFRASQYKPYKPAELPLSPKSQKDEGGCLEKGNVINSEYKQHQLWKKQIDNYFYCRKKCNRGKELKKWLLWTAILQNLLRCSVEQNYNNFCQKSAHSLPKKYVTAYKLDTVQQLSVFNKPSKSSYFHLIILSYRPQSIKKCPFFFDVQVLNLDGKIQFAKINLRNWEELNAQLQMLSQFYSILMVVVFEKQKIINLYAQNSEYFLKLIGPFEDMNSITTFEQIQVINLLKMNGKNKINEQDHANTCINIKKCIEKYLFLKKQFQLRLRKGQDEKCFSQDETMIMMLANNLLYNVVSPDKQFELQVPSYHSTILQLFSEANNKLTRVKVLVDNNKGHFPFNLDNAHLCWSCKTKRIYTYCPTCTALEGHPIALCLNCYQPFHEKRIKQIPEQGDESNQILFNQWQALDRSFQQSIRQTKQTSTKKQQNDLNSQ